jgi:HEAT repeat protein
MVRRSDTLRPPAAGNEERVSLRVPVVPLFTIEEDLEDSTPSAETAPIEDVPPSDERASSRPPPPSRDSRVDSSMRPRAPDPRTDEGHTVRAEIARSSIEATRSSIPAPTAPDRDARILAIARELASSGPELDAPLRRRLLAIGPDAVPHLCRVFPGALWVDLTRPHRLRGAHQISAAASCLVAFGEHAVPYLPRLLKSRHLQVRLAAVLVAGDLVDGSLVRPLTQRLSDEVPAVRNLAMLALRACALLPQMRELRAEMISTLEDSRTPAKWRRKAAWTLGQLRDAEAVPLLIDQLGAEPEVATVARQALITVTGRDLGRFRIRWHAYWARNSMKPRLEWLIDALDQSEAELRARVAEELVLLTGEGYDRRHAASSRDAAKDLAQHYRKWLRETGKS